MTKDEWTKRGDAAIAEYFRVTIQHGKEVEHVFEEGEFSCHAEATYELHREALAASEQRVTRLLHELDIAQTEQAAANRESMLTAGRNRELTARLDAAEKVLNDIRADGCAPNESETDLIERTVMRCAAYLQAPDQPVAGEERTPK